MMKDGQGCCSSFAVDEDFAVVVSCSDSASSGGNSCSLISERTWRPISSESSKLAGNLLEQAVGRSFSV